MKTEYQLILNNESDTLNLGETLAKTMPPGLIIYLHGDLGTGKTTLMRGVLRGLGFLGKVKSPTYTLVEPYEISSHRLFHFDLYRLHTPRELHDLGMEDYADGEANCWIEWPEKGQGYLPAPDLECSLSYHNEGRICLLQAKTPRALAWLAQAFA
jgi:tRNA threonylcarbamoyladenosine biosynthesis protein TsaE